MPSILSRKNLTIQPNRALKQPIYPPKKPKQAKYLQILLRPSLQVAHLITKP